MSSSQCFDQLHNADTVHVVARRLRVSKRVAARHKGGHAALSRTFIVDHDDYLHRTCVGLE